MSKQSKNSNDNEQSAPEMGSLLISGTSPCATTGDDIDERLEAEIYATLNGTSIKGFHGNKQLKGAGEVIEYTPEQIKIYKRCAKNPLYFINHFVKVVTLDHGLQQIKLRDYQRDLVKAFIKNRMNIVLAARQSGKSISYVCFVLWYILFNKHKTVVILANKGDTAMGIVQRIELAYYNLPKWLQQGVESWNKGSFELENGCCVISAASSSQAIRSVSASVLIVDECYSGDNTIKIRNKNTGEIKTITLKEFYESL